MTDTNPAKFKKLVTLLKELFQLDQPDLDFGIYRIMHAKAGEVTKFLERDLLPQVKDAFSQYQSADSAELKRKLDQMVAQLTDAGVDPDTSPKVRELREQMKGAIDIGALENEVYDHLYSFFRRYYSEGDFLAKRVYKPGVYAIPYEGEEVTLHWANKDQYYIKTSEYLRDYAFRLRPEAAEGQDPMRVHFRLVDAAEGEHGNVKAAEGKDRVFVLAKEELIGLSNGELDIGFEYRPATLEDWPETDRAGKKKPPAQKELTALAVERILASHTELTEWLSELKRPHVKADGEQADYTRLEAHLRRYSARNTFDYFIHKDLGGFLRRELDFYIKNEVMHLDDVENETAPKVEQYLSKIKVIRRIAGKVIDFLAQLENFQKKLWLKKKFVVGSDWLVAISQVPDDLLAEVCANKEQLEEWKRLHSLHELPTDLTRPAFSEPLSFDYLRSLPSLMIDTRHFQPSFIDRLQEAVGEQRFEVDGMLIQSENFQALRFMERRYAAQVNCIYIDPPYNTDGSPISYKNGYRSSTWVSLIENRLQASIGYLASDSVFCVTIDDYQQRELVDRLDAAFSKERRLGTAAIRINPSGRITKDGLAVTHEYALFYGLSEDSALGKIARSERQAQRFNAADDGGAFEWRNFRREGSSSERAARPRRFFPIYVNEARELRVPEMTWDEDARRYDILEQPADSEVAVYPRDSNGDDRVWRWGLDRTRDGLDQIEARSDARNGLQLYYKYRPDDDGVLAPSIWADAKYSATEHGTALLKKILGERNAFSFPKSIHATTDCIRIAGMDREYGLCLDYFAGSGTTGHAVISLNREDGGRRRFILVEMEKYFEEVTLPRIKKVSFAPEWKAGKPERFPTQDEAVRSPRLIKVLRLESYEDALNNLALRRGASLQSALNFSGAVDQDNLKEKYLLRYQLDVESRGSASLLDVRALSDSTAYKLKVKKPGSDESHEVNVDLLETFNWLLGLTVQQITAPRSFRAEFERDDEGRLQLKGRLRQSNEGPFWFRTVTGTTPEGRKTLVIWRKLTGEPEQDNLALEEWFKNKQAYSVRDAEFDLIYVNGDNTLENLRVDPETWKVRLIEEDFHRLMFEGTEA